MEADIIVAKYDVALVQRPHDQLASARLLLTVLGLREQTAISAITSRKPEPAVSPANQPITDDWIK